jgi:hypothetical protein
VSRLALGWEGSFEGYALPREGDTVRWRRWGLVLDPRERTSAQLVTTFEEGTHCA